MATTFPTLTVDIAPTGGPSTASPTWVDISSYVRIPDGVSWTFGRADETGLVSAGTLSLALNNDGRFTPGSATALSAWGVDLRIRVPIRVRSDLLPIWRGFVDTWDTAWTGGKRGVAQLRASDRIARLQRRTFRSMLEEEILYDGPSGYWTLSEDSAATTAGDTSGYWSTPTTLTATQLGAGGTLTFGSGTGPGYDGLSAAVAAPSSVVNGLYLTGTTTSDIAGLTGVTLEAFVNTSTALDQIIAEVRAAATGTRTIGLPEFSLGVTAASKLTGTITGPSGLNTTVTSASNVTGGTKHVALTAAVSAGTVTLTLYLNGASVGTGTFADTSLTIPRYVDALGGGVITGSLLTGTVSHIAVHPTALAADRILAHYQAGMTGFTGETTTARFARLARLADVPSALYSPGSGATTMGPQPTQGKSALAAIQEVDAAERGVTYVSPGGVLTFQARSSRYAAASSFTLTNADIGSDLVYTTDDTYLLNDVTVTRYGGATTRIVAASSVANYDTYSTDVSIYTDSDTYSANLANYLVNTYSTPAARVGQVTVDLIAKASSAPVSTIKTATVGTRFAVTGLPTSSGAPSASADLFIEGGSGTVNELGWQWRVNTSPVSSTSVWILGDSTYGVLGTTTRLAF